MVTGVGVRSQLAVQNLVEMRRRLDDLQRQLGTGKKSDTYAGFGLDRGLGVSLRAQLATVASYETTISVVGIRLDLAQRVLGRLSDIGREAKSAMLIAGTIKPSGQTAAQENARTQLGELLDLLNTQADNRYLFAGRDLEKPPVQTAEHILDGDGMRAGLTQIISERTQADLGTSGLGRLTMSNTAGTLTVAEDVAGSPFGFKLTGATTNIVGATITGPTDSPPAIAVALGTNPAPGDTVSFTLALPDGTSETVRLTATASVTPAADEFAIGANPTATAANLQIALNAEIRSVARTSLAAASAVKAAEDFFNIGVGDPPLRVAGPPFDSATAVVAGTTANTMFWYTGEMSADPARTSATARIDGSIAVNYGLRANEEGLRVVVQNVAAFAAVTVAPAGVDGPAKYAALTDRLQPPLSNPAGMQKIDDIATDLAAAQMTLKAGAERHQQTRNVTDGLLDKIEGVPTEQVAAEILALQTRLQATLQTTAMLYQMNLSDYL